MDKPKGIDDVFDYDEYRAYLSSSIWDEKRNQRLEFDDFQCRLCGNRNNVQVHHLVYPLHQNYGAETINDLITVCPDCHKLLDKLRKGQHIELYKRYKPSVYIRCWIRFASLDECEIQKRDMEKKFDMHSGNIPVFGFLKGEHLINHHLGEINIYTYAKLKETYGEKNIRLEF